MIRFQIPMPGITPDVLTWAIETSLAAPTVQIEAAIQRRSGKSVRIWLNETRDGFVVRSWAKTFPVALGDAEIAEIAAREFLK